MTDLHTPTQSLVEKCEKQEHEIQKLQERVKRLEMFNAELKREHIELLNERKELFRTSISIPIRMATELREIGTGNLSKGIKIVMKERKALWEGKRA